MVILGPFSLLFCVVYCSENNQNYNLFSTGKLMSPPYWSDAVLYRKSDFGTAKRYKLIK